MLNTTGHVHNNTAEDIYNNAEQYKKLLHHKLTSKKTKHHEHTF